MLRMRQYLSAWRARRGRCSQIWIPGTFVAMGRNSPRNSGGASGFKSNVSSWLGPPKRNTITHERARPKLNAAGRAQARGRHSGSSSPMAASPPTWSISRRVQPSQARCAAPTKRSTNRSSGPKKGVWNFQALKTSAFVDTGEFQTPPGACHEFAAPHPMVRAYPGQEVPPVERGRVSVASTDFVPATNPRGAHAPRSSVIDRRAPSGTHPDSPAQFRHADGKTG